MFSHLSFKTDIVAGKGAGNPRIPGGVWAHLGDQKSGYLVEEGAAIGPPTDLDSEALS